MNENVKDTNIELKDEERTKCEIWTRVMAVSYTHLDVYKRQGRAQRKKNE